MSDFDTPREILDKLVSFPTVSRNSNLDLVDWVEDWLDQRGVSATRVYSADGRKAALYAHVGPMDPGAVVLSGHTDVVPVDGQDWTSDPFTVTERNGLLFGRGTVDMKGFDALALWAMGEAAKLELRRPLQIALSYDEEIGCLGAPVMIDHMLASGMPKGDLVIVGEPSSMACVTGHKGGFGYDIQIQGFEVHSSIMHTGVSAVMEAGRLIEWANQENETLMAGPHSPMADMFDPPWTTVHVGTIEGGTAQNITAADCRMGLGFRLVPDETTDHWQDRLTAQIEAQERRMKAVAPSSGIALHQTYSVPPLKPETDGAAESLVRNITGDNASHVVSYGTEAGQFQERGFSAVVCGPGDIAQAHQPDEYISVEQFLSGQRFMEELVRKLSYQQ